MAGGDYCLNVQQFVVECYSKRRIRLISQVKKNGSGFWAAPGYVELKNDENAGGWIPHKVVFYPSPVTAGTPF
jgi:hypothetical protein